MSVVPLADVAAHLNRPESDDAEKLLSFIDAAEAAIARRVGPLEPTEVEVTLRSAGGSTLILPIQPVIALTSVASGSTAITGGVADLDAGLISLDYGARFPLGDVTVTYIAGRTVLPEDLVMAVKELVRHLWATQRGPTGRPGSPISDSTSNTVPGAAYLFPFRVEQLIAPHENPSVA